VAAKLHEVNRARVPTVQAERQHGHWVRGLVELQSFGLRQPSTGERRPGICALCLLCGDFGWWLSGQVQPQLVQQHAVLALGLRVSRQDQLAAVGGGQMHVHLLHGLELGQHLARCRATGQCSELGLEGDLQAIRQEGHEDMGLDAFLGLVEDRPDRQVVLDLLEERGAILPVNISRARS
jgi:hypothetical protein